MILESAADKHIPIKQLKHHLDLYNYELIQLLNSCQQIMKNNPDKKIS